MSEIITAFSSSEPLPKGSLVRCDEGRLIVDSEFLELLQQHGLTTFQALYACRASGIAKNTLRERVTVRVELGKQERKRAFYLKRHSPTPIWEYVKSLSRLRIPLIGARNEWDALRAWKSISLPTQTPVAYGRSGRHSLLLTVALEECDKLSHLIESDRNGSLPLSAGLRQQLTRSVARLVRRMHDLGWHHQDCYTGHFLVRRHDRQMFLIDLGRARRMRLFKKLWIRKDLAQLAYSASGCSLSDQYRFLREYWGRPFRQWEKLWCRKILHKVRKIARHTERHTEPPR
jgi:heptose I phosphotransferase